MQIKIPVLCCLLLFLSFSCKKDNSAVQPNVSLFSGIAHTDDIGVILTDDPEDWQPRTANNPPQLPLSSSPAYPNPTNSMATIIIVVGETDWYVCNRQEGTGQNGNC